MRHGSVCAAAMVLGVATGAGAQESDPTPSPVPAETEPAKSPADLFLEQIEAQRVRIEALERRVTELTGERRQMAGTLRQIEGMLANMRSGLEGEPTPRPPVGRAEIPSEALASPDSLLRELRGRYAAHMAGMGLATEAERAVFAQRAQLWARLTQRELRGKRSWLVTLDDLAPVGTQGHVVRMAVLDERTGLAIGEALDVGFPAKFLERYGRGSRSGRWVLTSIVIARPVFNESRVNPGVFEFPPFVGPMMEFDFELDWYALSAWEPGQPVAPPPDLPADEPAPEDAAQNTSG